MAPPSTVLVSGRDQYDSMVHEAVLLFEGMRHSANDSVICSTIKLVTGVLKGFDQLLRLVTPDPPPYHSTPEGENEIPSPVGRIISTVSIGLNLSFLR